LGFVRAAIAQQYDLLLNKIFERRNVGKTEPVSPSLAIPLLRAAYDESRPELQQLWAELIAAAMDPNRSAGVRLSFITAVKQFDPLDALVLKELHVQSGQLAPNSRDVLAHSLQRSPNEIEVSAQNLHMLRCVQNSQGWSTFYITSYGRELMRVCSG
jgi:Abortive infection alpha